MWGSEGCWWPIGCQVLLQQCLDQGWCDWVQRVVPQWGYLLCFYPACARTSSRWGHADHIARADGVYRGKNKLRIQGTPRHGVRVCHGGCVQGVKMHVEREGWWEDGGKGMSVAGVLLV